MLRFRKSLYCIIALTLVTPILFTGCKQSTDSTSTKPGLTFDYEQNDGLQKEKDPAKAEIGVIEIGNNGIKGIPFGTFLSKASDTLTSRNIPFQVTGYAHNYLLTENFSVDGSAPSTILLEFSPETGLVSLLILIDCLDWDTTVQTANNFNIILSKALGSEGRPWKLSRSALDKESNIDFNKWKTDLVEANMELSVAYQNKGYNVHIKMETSEEAEKNRKTMEEMRAEKKRLMSNYTIPQIGMSRDDVIEIWGQPCSVNTTETALGTHEQWVMDCNISKRFVYFENGVCTAVQY